MKSYNHFLRLSNFLLFNFRFSFTLHQRVYRKGLRHVRVAVQGIGAGRLVSLLETWKFSIKMSKFVNIASWWNISDNMVWISLLFMTSDHDYVFLGFFFFNLGIFERTTDVWAENCLYNRHYTNSIQWTPTKESQEKLGNSFLQIEVTLWQWLFCLVWALFMRICMSYCIGKMSVSLDSQQRFIVWW